MATKRICSIPSCDKIAERRDWCFNHYMRWRAHGNPLGGGKSPGEVTAFLNDVVLTYDGDDCLHWPYGSVRGYGVVNCKRRKRRKILVTRLVCEHVHGPAPSLSHQAAHSCGKGHEGCCNPRHIRWATPKENCADKEIHGTVNRGQRQGSSKLTEEDVRQIRSLRGVRPQRELSAMFGVSRWQISEIQTKKQWAWLV
jgi:hypothetical protein